MLTIEFAPSLALKAKLFRGFSDPSRLAILESVREGAHSVTEIVEISGLTQSNVSNHLACLLDCGLVEREQRGRFAFYRLADPRVWQLLALGGRPPDRCSAWGLCVPPLRGAGMTGVTRPREILRRVATAVLLVGLMLSSVEVLWAEGKEPASADAASTVEPSSSHLDAPASPDEGGDDCPCMCVCANAQVVVLPDPSVEPIPALVPLRAPAFASSGPDDLLPEPLLRPPRA